MVAVAVEAVGEVEALGRAGGDAKAASLALGRVGFD
jgi:hypothetical protein